MREPARGAGPSIQSRATRAILPTRAGSRAAPPTPAAPTSGGTWRSTSSATSCSCRRRRRRPIPGAGMRPGDNRYANSIVALRGATGEVVWHFQIVHHAIWDYDVAAQPLLVDLPRNGTTVPALVQNTKQGLVFVFNRETGRAAVPDRGTPGPARRPAGRVVLADATVPSSSRRRWCRRARRPMMPGASPGGTGARAAG